MKKQALVIGMGQFGISLTRTLAQRGVDVMAVDTDPSLVQIASAWATEAVCFDATDEDALSKAAPERRDVCVCSIGPESRESAIIVTALLRQMGARRIVARASDELTERILKLVGAHEVVNPEKAFGERLAGRLLYEGLVDQVPLGEDLVITEVHPPAVMVGRTLVELALPKKWDVTVVAIKRTVGGKGVLMMANPNNPLLADDILIVASSTAAVNRLLEKQS